MQWYGALKEDGEKSRAPTHFGSFASAPAPGSTRARFGWPTISGPFGGTPMTATTAPQVQKPTTWQIDPAHSLVEFAVKHMLFATVKGRFGGVHGTIVDDAADPSRSSVEVEIDAASIDTREEKRDAHLRSTDFLDVQTYPTITFKSSRVGRAGHQGRPR